MVYSVALFDYAWQKVRHEFYTNLLVKDKLILDLSKCTWMDLEPLTELFNGILARCALNYYTSILLPKKIDGRYPVLSGFLLDSGFLNGIEAFTGGKYEMISFQIDNNQFTSNNISTEIKASKLPPILDHRFVLPCKLIDVSTLSDREDVFRYCKNLFDEIKPKCFELGIGIATGLGQQCNLFFTSVLPELVDNVRLHKRNSHNKYFSLAMRIRRRQERLDGPQRKFESVQTGLLPLNRITWDLWWHDMLEIVATDNGETIQQSWISRWQERNKNEGKKYPRL